MLRYCYYDVVRNYGGSYVWEISPMQEGSTGWLSCLENDELEEYLRSLNPEFPELWINLMNEGNIVLRVEFEDFTRRVLRWDIRWVK